MDKIKEFAKMQEDRAYEILYKFFCNKNIMKNENEMIYLRKATPEEDYNEHTDAIIQTIREDICNGLLKTSDIRQGIRIDFKSVSAEHNNGITKTNFCVNNTLFNCLIKDRPHLFGFIIDDEIANNTYLIIMRYDDIRLLRNYIKFNDEYYLVNPYELTKYGIDYSIIDENTLTEHTFIDLIY